MKIPVYEITQYNGPIVTTSAAIRPTRAGVYAETVTRTIRFRGQEGRAANDLRTPQPLPCNWRTLPREKLFADLRASGYGRVYTSTLGRDILEAVL